LRNISIVWLPSIKGDLNQIKSNQTKPNQTKPNQIERKCIECIEKNITSFGIRLLTKKKRKQYFGKVNMK
jgi:hypothetical protein